MGHQLDPDAHRAVPGRQSPPNTQGPSGSFAPGTSPVCPAAHPYSPAEEEVKDVHGGAESTAPSSAPQATLLHGPLATAVVERPFVGV